jgi:hypothetical protein
MPWDLARSFLVQIIPLLRLVLYYQYDLMLHALIFYYYRTALSLLSRYLSPAAWTPFHMSEAPPITSCLMAACCLVVKYFL